MVLQLLANLFMGLTFVPGDTSNRGKLSPATFAPSTVLVHFTVEYTYLGDVRVGVHTWAGPLIKIPAVLSSCFGVLISRG
jgi:hypothetical protein